MILDEEIQKRVQLKIDLIYQNVEDDSEYLSRELTDDEEQYETLKEHIRNKMLDGIKSQL